MFYNQTVLFSKHFLFLFLVVCACEAITTDTALEYAVHFRNERPLQLLKITQEKRALQDEIGVIYATRNAFQMLTNMD